mmetsp:Transcript_34298/g.89084  ORF Transcript_34298/g.89084 Transcript_34298/m.89084 type:complete len:244 (+) Transcript_34298:201-932(+)
MPAAILTTTFLVASCAAGHAKPQPRRGAAAGRALPVIRYAGATRSPRQGQRARAATNGSSDFTPLRDPTPSTELAMGTMVSAVMTPQPIQVCYPDTTVDEALEILGSQRLTGMPVVDRETGKLVGILSDFDLISLEKILKPSLGEASSSKHVKDIFPATGESWMAFKAVTKLVETQMCKNVAECMSTNVYTVSPDTSIEDAAKLLLSKDVRRVPVLDANGNMVGIMSRSNIVQAAVKARRGEL